MAQQDSELDWAASLDSTIVRVHQHAATLPGTTGALMNCKKSADKLADHAIGRSRGGLTTSNHLVCDGKGTVLAFVVGGGQLNTGHHVEADRRCRGPLSAPVTLSKADRGQGLPLEGEPYVAAPAWHRGHDPRAGRSDRAPAQTPGPADRLGKWPAPALPGLQCRRAVFQSSQQAVARGRDALGHARPKLSRRAEPRWGASLIDYDPLAARPSRTVTATTRFATPN